MEITLAGEQIEMKFTFTRLNIIEKNVGSIYGYLDKCAKKTVTTSDIVCIYYNAQESTAYNEQQIFEKVILDGMVIHIANTYDLLARSVFGKEVVDKVKEESEKSEKK